MNKGKIISYSAAATMALSLNSCGQEQTTENEVQAATFKADSAAQKTPGYIATTNSLHLYEARINEYRENNKNMVKIYASEYLRKHIKDVRLRNFLISALGNQVLIDVSDFDVDEIACDVADINKHYVNKMRLFRRNQRWYNDLSLYLSDKYNEKQFLKSKFFDVVNNPELKETFKRNTNQMEQLNLLASVASKRQSTIYNDLWNHYMDETKTTKR